MDASLDVYVSWMIMTEIVNGGRIPAVVIQAYSSPPNSLRNGHELRSVEDLGNGEGRSDNDGDQGLDT